MPANRAAPVAPMQRAVPIVEAVTSDLTAFWNFKKNEPFKNWVNVSG